MNTQLFIWVFYFLSAGILVSSRRFHHRGSLFQNIQSDSIDSSVRLGQFIDIEPEVVIEADSVVGSFAKIAQNTYIGENSQVGGYTTVGERCKIASNVKIGSFGKLGSEVVIGSDSILDGYNAVGDGAKIGNSVKLNFFSAVGSNAEVGNSVRLNQYSTVGSDARIGDDCILNKFSAAGDNAVLSSKAYVGQYSYVAPYLTVGELAVIHNFVETESGKNIKPKQVVIRTPSSFDLYQSCELNVPTEKANIADRRTNGVISPEFNSMLGEMIETELNSLRTNCAQDENGQTRPTTLPEIISLYLIQYHGLQRFEEIIQQFDQLRGIHSISIINGNVYINGNSYIIIDGSLLLQLQHEYHFGNDSPNNILEPEVKQKFIQLLAIDQDARRYVRVISDTFCKMLQEILDGDRDVTCAKPILKSQTIFIN